MPPSPNPRYIKKQLLLGGVAGDTGILEVYPDLLYILNYNSAVVMLSTIFC